MDGWGPDITYTIKFLNDLTKSHIVPSAAFKYSQVIQIFDMSTSCDKMLSDPCRKNYVT